MGTHDDTMLRFEKLFTQLITSEDQFFYGKTEQQRKAERQKKMDMSQRYFIPKGILLPIDYFLEEHTLNKKIRKIGV